MLYIPDSSGSSKMVTNVELGKEVDEQKTLIEEKTRILDEAIEEMKDKLKEMEDETQEKESECLRINGGKKKLEDEIPELDLSLGKGEPFLRALKALGGKSLENVSLFHGKMDAEVVLE